MSWLWFPQKLSLIIQAPYCLNGLNTTLPKNPPFCHCKEAKSPKKMTELIKLIESTIACLEQPTQKDQMDPEVLSSRRRQESKNKTEELVRLPDMQTLIHSEHCQSEESSLIQRSLLQYVGLSPWKKGRAAGEQWVVAEWERRVVRQTHAGVAGYPIVRLVGTFGPLT